MSENILDVVKTHITGSDVPLVAPKECVITAGYSSFILDPTSTGQSGKFPAYLKVGRDDLRTRLLLSVYDNPVVITEAFESQGADTGTALVPSAGYLVLPSAVIPVPGTSLETTGANVSTPAAGTVLATVAAPAGNYEVEWITHNNITIGLGNNYGLYINGVLAGTSDNGTPAGFTTQPNINVSVPVAGTISVRAIATDATGTYQAAFTAIPVGNQPAVESPTGMSPLELYGTNEFYIYAVAGFGNARVSIMRERRQS